MEAVAWFAALAVRGVYVRVRLALMFVYVRVQ